MWNEVEDLKDKQSITRESVLSLLEEISPMARAFVDDVFEKAVILYAQSDQNGEGVFLKVALDDVCIYYANFPDDSSEELLMKISEEIERTVSTSGELCFNVHGSNARIIQLVQSKGYVLDMEGYILQYSASEVVPVDLGELTTEAPTRVQWDSFVELFDAAYEPLNRENGWDTKGYSKAAGSFLQRMKQLEKEQSFKSFWKDGALIGCYIVDGCYITDIVVHPRFQNQGYGSLILRHCIRLMREDKGISEICLRVTKSNTGAKRLYERNGFTTISYFAEHVYQAK